jgi:hypothetical protein
MKREEQKYMMPKHSNELGIFNWKIDLGHGGMWGDKYTTPARKGKRSPDWHNGVYYEGVGNRDFFSRIMDIIHTLELPLRVSALMYSEMDIPLSVRTETLNTLWKYDKTVRGISIHSNGGGGSGLSGFTSIGETESDDMCEVWYNENRILFPDEYFYTRTRVDGDQDIEKNFWILVESYCPIFLVELLFMDNKKDYDKLHIQEIRWKLALGIVNTMLVYENKPRIEWSTLKLKMGL